MWQQLDLDTFIEKLVKEKYKEGITLDLCNEYKRDLLPRLQKWIILKTAEKLKQVSPKAFEDLMKLYQKGLSTQDAQIFVEKYLSNPRAFMSEVLSSFRSTYLAG